MIEEMLIFISLGVFSGLLAGLFGIGGGTLIVPVLIACFFGMGFEENIIVHLALGTSMACIIFTLTCVINENVLYYSIFLGGRGGAWRF